MRIFLDNLPSTRLGAKLGLRPFVRVFLRGKFRSPAGLNLGPKGHQP